MLGLAPASRQQKCLDYNTILCVHSDTVGAWVRRRSCGLASALNALPSRCSGAVPNSCGEGRHETTACNSFLLFRISAAGNDAECGLWRQSSGSRPGRQAPVCFRTFGVDPCVRAFGLSRCRCNLGPLSAICVEEVEPSPESCT